MTLGLAEWIQDLQTRRQATIRSPVSVISKQDRHLGPRWEYAEIELTAEPSDAWDVEVSLPEVDRVEMEKDRWLREAILGVLDVLISRPSDPLLRIRLRVTAAQYTFESSRRAFRMAGQRAAEALIDAAEIVR